MKNIYTLFECNRSWKYFTIVDYCLFLFLLNIYSISDYSLIGLIFLPSIAYCTSFLWWKSTSALKLVV